MKILLNIYIGLTFLLLLDAVLYVSSQISLPGHFSDWLLLWTWIILTIAVITLNMKKRWTRIYSIALAGFTILTMLPMMIPFLTIVAFAFDTDDKRYRINNEVALQEHSISVISMPTIVAIKSFGLYERIVGETEFYFQINDNSYRIQDATSIRQRDSVKGEDSLRIEFKFKDGIVIRSL
jgi:hypothetical protein